MVDKRLLQTAGTSTTRHHIPADYVLDLEYTT
jgi:hypothetical protein